MHLKKNTRGSFATCSEAQDQVWKRARTHALTCKRVQAQTCVQACQAKRGTHGKKTFRLLREANQTWVCSSSGGFFFLLQIRMTSVHQFVSTEAVLGSAIGKKNLGKNDIPLKISNGFYCCTDHGALTLMSKIDIDFRIRTRLRYR